MIMLGDGGERKLRQHANSKEKQESENTDNKQLKYNIVLSKRVSPECCEIT